MRDGTSEVVLETSKQVSPSAHVNRQKAQQLAPVVPTEIRIKGETRFVPSVMIYDRTVITRGRWLKIAAVQDEDLIEGDVVVDPAGFVARLKETELNADVFTFAQSIPNTNPRYSYHIEWDNLAVIPITTFADWWDKQAEPSVRRAVRKAGKAGVSVRLARFDDAFVQGIVHINNETPVRQGRPFWHYGKSVESVRRENSTYAERNIFLGAYFEDELIGFIRITYKDRVANIVQILSMIKHYDKRPANALIAKAVEICSQRELTHLVYYSYVYNDPKSSLTEFKRRNGFQKVLLPRYYISLTTKGTIALKCGLHHSLVKRIPQPLLTALLKFRTQWNARRLKAAEANL